MPDDVKKESFVSNATIYTANTAHGFAPGTPVELHPDHAADLRKAGLEAKPDEKVEPKAPAKAK